MSLTKRHAQHLLLVAFVLSACSVAHPTGADDPRNDNRVSSRPQVGMSQPAVHVDPARAETLAEELRSADLGIRLSSLVRAARAPKDTLPALEWLARQQRAETRAAVRQALSLMLLKTISGDDLAAYPALNEILATETRAAEHALQVLRSPAHWFPNAIRSQTEPEPVSPEEAAIHRASELQGFAVPTAADLCRSPRPLVRIYGAYLIVHLHATSQADLLRRVLEDTSTFRMSHGDGIGEESIGSVIAPYVADEATRAYFQPGASTSSLTAAAVEAEHSYRSAAEITLGPGSGIPVRTALRASEALRGATDVESYISTATHTLSKLRLAPSTARSKNRARNSFLTLM
jgi:hypothetical protein